MEDRWSGVVVVVRAHTHNRLARVLAAGRVVRHDGDLLRVLSAPGHMVVTEGRRRLALH